MTSTTEAPTVQRRGPGRPKGGAAVASRDQLLAAAQRAVEAIGPGVTMDDIADEANVSKPILYRLVGDRNTVVDALSDVLVDRISGFIAGTAGFTGEPRVDFVALVRAYFTAVRSDRNLYLFVNSIGQRPEPLRRRVERSGQQLVALFAAGRTPSSAGSATAPQTWGYSVIGALQTVTLMWIDDAAADLDAIADDVAHLLWPGVASALGFE
ncbi:MAG: AcrR family transcriptional regulator [Candidatus Aldehydirespiratoraceae bacterium]